MPRLAWFSPMPPSRSGVAVASAELVPALRVEHEIDVFADNPADSTARSAHDFVWEHAKRPYDLVVYQLGNSSFHDYAWPYLFRFPGLAVLHDAHLHHARAAALLRTRRAADYRAEFAASHPGVDAAMAELAVAGFDSHLYYRWPMRRLVAEASRVTAVHATALADDLREESPSAVIETIPLAHGELVDEARAAAARQRVRAARGIAPDAVLFGVFGGLTPEKRLPQVLDAFDAVRRYVPAAHLLLAGAAAAHYDVAADVAARGLAAAVTLTGYLATDADVTGHLAACDVSLNLRWPTAREVSGPWLRALAAGRATITIDLVHTAHVPSLDPRSWTVSHARAERHAGVEPVTVAIDILDEAHSLRLAMRRLAADGELRAQLGAAARDYWQREHSPARMLAEYERVIRRAIDTPAPAPGAHWPPHVLDRGDRTLTTVLQAFPGVTF